VTRLIGALALVGCALGCAPAWDCEAEQWVGAWAAAPSDEGIVYSDQSLRVVLVPMRGGQLARVRLSNRFGLEPITFRSVHLGKQRSGAQLVAGSNQPVLFHGQAEVTVAAGEQVESDGVAMSFAAFEPLAVSVFVPAPGGALQHSAGRHTSFASPPGSGDLASGEDSGGFTASGKPVPFVVAVDVRAPGRDSVVATIGDSITDGTYPDFLARRLDGGAHGLSVVDLGIAGNRVLGDGLFPWNGPALLNRVTADLIDRSDVTDVIILEGINDLAASPELPAEQLIEGLDAVVRMIKSERAGRPAPNVLVGTLTSAAGVKATFAASYIAAEPKRQAINDYLRTHGLGDGLVDFDRALRDAADPSKLAPVYDSGDGLHPSAAGYQRMADEVDLTMLRGRRCP
jgi:lysophospholipase L1-like esterase